MPRLYIIARGERVRSTVNPRGPLAPQNGATTLATIPRGGVGFF